MNHAGAATVFPQPIGWGATFNPALIRAVGIAVSDEARATNNAGGAYGLSVWAPNANLFRDPRWGRGHETVGKIMPIFLFFVGGMVLWLSSQSPIPCPRSFTRG